MRPRPAGVSLERSARVSAVKPHWVQSKGDVEASETTGGDHRATGFHVERKPAPSALRSLQLMGVALSSRGVRPASGVSHRRSWSRVPRGTPIRMSTVIRPHATDVCSGSNAAAMPVGMTRACRRLHDGGRPTCNHIGASSPRVTEQCSDAGAARPGAVPREREPLRATARADGGGGGTRTATDGREFDYFAPAVGGTSAHHPRGTDRSAGGVTVAPRGSNLVPLRTRRRGRGFGPSPTARTGSSPSRRVTGGRGSRWQATRWIRWRPSVSRETRRGSEDEAIARRLNAGFTAQRPPGDWARRPTRRLCVRRHGSAWTAWDCCSPPKWTSTVVCDVEA